MTALKSKTVLLMGGRGFLGGHVCRQLIQSGYQVLLQSTSSVDFENLSDLLPHPQVKTVQFDPYNSYDYQAVKTNCDYLIHCALPYSLQTIGQQKRREKNLRQLEDFLKASKGLKKAVFISASGTIGKSHSQPATEILSGEALDSIPSLRDKWSMEKLILSYNSPELPIVVVNPAQFFGEYDTKPSTGEFFKFIVNSPFIFLRDQPINIVGVEDVAKGIVLALEKGRAGERYLLSGENTTLWELAKHIRKNWGKSAPLGSLPFILLKSMSYISESLSHLLKLKKPAIPMVGLDIMKYGNQHYDHSKATNELLYQPGSAWQAIDKAARWYQSVGYLPAKNKKGGPTPPQIETTPMLKNKIVKAKPKNTKKINELTL